MKTILLLLLFVVVRPLYEPARYPVIDFVHRDNFYTACRIGPVIVAWGRDFVMHGEQRRDGSVLIHWYFNGEYSHTDCETRMPRL